MRVRRLALFRFMLTSGRRRRLISICRRRKKETTCGARTHLFNSWIKTSRYCWTFPSDIKRSLWQSVPLTPSPDTQNQYQLGDLVLFQLNPDEPLPTKLTPKFVGPYEVSLRQRTMLDAVTSSWDTSRTST